MEGLRVLGLVWSVKGGGFQAWGVGCRIWSPVGSPYNKDRPIFVEILHGS